jgi:ribonuclease HI
MLGLQILSSIGVKSVEAFSDSLLVMQQVAGVFQCFNRSLNAYLDKWLEIFALFDDFTLANNLAQQASCFRSNQEKFGFLKKLDIPIC